MGANTPNTRLLFRHILAIVQQHAVISETTIQDKCSADVVLFFFIGPLTPISYLDTITACFVFNGRVHCVSHWPSMNALISSP